MNKTMTKVLSLLMAVMMIAGALPIGATAGVWDDLQCTAGAHNLAWVTTKPATCTEEGTRVYKCVNCNAVKESESIAKIPHTEVAIPAKAATCTEAGYGPGKTCSVCNTVIEECEPIAALGHKPKTLPAVPATCVSNGLLEGSKCETCDTVLVAQVSVPATGHKFKVTSRTEATCTSKGSEVKTCETCGFVETTVIDEAHVFGSWKVKTAPTCTVKGVMIKTCSKCSAQVEEEIPATGHTKISVVEKAPTCTEPGLKAGEKCSVCGSILSGCEQISATGHTSTKVPGKAATCTEKGLSDGYYCPKCNETFVKQEEIPALGHNMVYDSKASKAPSCTATGLTVMKCSRTGCTETTQEVEPITHNVQWQIDAEPTCTKEGTRSGYCSACKKTISEKIPATGHKTSPLLWAVAEAATCTKDGKKVQTCSVCGKTATEIIPATGHKEVVIPGKAATCTNAGLTDGKYCEYCGEITVKQETSPKAPHTYGEWTIKDDSTCSKVGVKEAVCTVCKEKTTEMIEKKPHTEKVIEAVAPTCTEPGNEAGSVCTVCSAIVVEAKVLEALGHDWVDGGNSKKPTCTEEGLDDYKCSRCDEVKSGVIPATGHQNTETVSGTPADCTLSGVQDGIKCLDCGVWVQEQAQIPALGHEWILNAEKSVAATCTSVGKDVYECSRCDAVNEVEAALIEHPWGEWTVDVEPTCTTTGHRFRVCTACNLMDEEDMTNGGGHNNISMPAVEPTCTTPGLTGGTYCDKCNTVFTEQQEVPALGHDYVTVVVTKASLSTPGQINTECTRCDEWTAETVDKISSIKLVEEKSVYDGQFKLPEIIVTDEAGEELVEGDDYIVTGAEEIIDSSKYDIKVSFIGNYEGSKTLTYTVTVGKTASVSRTSTNKGTMKLTWKPVEGAAGYSIYIYEATGSSKRIKLASVNANTTSYTIAKDYNGKALTVGKNYKVCVRAYSRDVDDNSVIYATGVVKTFKLYPAKITPTVSTKNGKVTIKWTDVAGEKGYQVWYSTSKNGKYVKLSNYAANKTSATTSKFDKGDTIYIKVRAYTKVDGSFVYGYFGNVKSITVK